MEEKKNLSDHPVSILYLIQITNEISRHKYESKGIARTLILL